MTSSPPLTAISSRTTARSVSEAEVPRRVRQRQIVAGRSGELIGAPQCRKRAAKVLLDEALRAEALLLLGWRSYEFFAAH